MTYALKFLWAPLLDHSRAPLFGRMGLRRGWLMLAQVGVLLGLVGMAFTTPGQLGIFIAFTLLVALAGATQDIAVDAYRIEIAPVADQGALVAVYSLGYRIALILSGAFALGFADHMPWWQVYLIMAVAMLVPIGANLRAREPEEQRRIGGTWSETMRAMFVDSFADFFRRYGVALSLWVLLFILLFKIPEQALVGGIMSPFYLDMGFTKTTIGVVTKFYGVWVGIAGVFAGGMLVARYNARKSLLIAMIITALCNLLYLLLIAHPGNVLVLTAVISGENFMLGVLGTTAVAFLSSLVNREHTATQYALLSSMVNLPGKILGVFAGGIVEATSYASSS
jgi:PAT family beta-lactamase induction signal transducer AmpG